MGQCCFVGCRLLSVVVLCRRRLLGPVHTSNNVEAIGNIVEATFDFVEATFDFVATHGNSVERFYCKISSFRQSRVLLRHFCRFWAMLPVLATISNEILSFQQSRNKLNMFNLFRLCRKNEISFDIVAETGNIVAKNGNNVEATFDIVERIVQLVAFDNVAWTLLLVWTGFNVAGGRTGRSPGAWKRGVGTLPAGGTAGRRAFGRSGGRHCTAGQYGFTLGVSGIAFVLAGLRSNRFSTNWMWKVKVTAGRRDGEDIHVDAGVSKSIF